VYKRSRALRRLIKYLDTNLVKSETISSFFLPLVASFVLDDAYIKHTTVQDAAVDAMALICRLLPWKLYVNQLKFFLKMLPKRLKGQKTIIKYVHTTICRHFNQTSTYIGASF